MNSKPFRILVVCTGNICRSPIGEALLRKRLADTGLDDRVEVESAGTNGWDELDAAPESIEEVEKRGASLDGFKSRLLTESIAERAHLILVCEYDHLDHIANHFSQCADKVRLLGHFLERPGHEEIPDPIGQAYSVYEEAASTIDSSIKRLIDDWPAVKRRYYDPILKVVAVGFDHRGFPIKDQLLKILQSTGVEIIDCGTNSDQSSDHPIFAFKVGELVSCGKADRGILICSSGHGMILAANRVPRVRAVLPLNAEHAIFSRQHNQSNVLAFGADYYTIRQIKEIVREWLVADFWGGKYYRRIQQIIDYQTNLMRRG